MYYRTMAAPPTASDTASDELPLRWDRPAEPAVHGLVAPRRVRQSWRRVPLGSREGPSHARRSERSASSSRDRRPRRFGSPTLTSIATERAARAIEQRWPTRAGPTSSSATSPLSADRPRVDPQELRELAIGAGVDGPIAPSVVATPALPVAARAHDPRTRRRAPPPGCDRAGRAWRAGGRRGSSPCCHRRPGPRRSRRWTFLAPPARRPHARVASARRGRVVACAAATSRVRTARSAGSSPTARAEPRRRRPRGSHRRPGPGGLSLSRNPLAPAPSAS